MILKRADQTLTKRRNHNSHFRSQFQVESLSYNRKYAILLDGQKFPLRNVHNTGTRDLRPMNVLALAQNFS